MRWEGFRRVRGQVRKRLRRRIEQLDLTGLESYRIRLLDDPGEWNVLDRLCRVTISRFYRDRAVFDRIAADLLPAMVREGARTVRCWSVGCASGEEPYTLALIRAFDPARRLEGVDLRVLATDADREMLRRAREARYPASSLRDLPEGWADRAFEKVGEEYRLRDEIRRAVEFRSQDVRGETPDDTYHLILCRNLVFTYFDESLQREILERVAARLAPAGFLAIGRHERLPAEARTVGLRDSGGGLLRRQS
jgi:chemotaxis protein methyltransferase CheR